MLSTNSDTPDISKGNLLKIELNIGISKIFGLQVLLRKFINIDKNGKTKLENNNFYN